MEMQMCSRMLLIYLRLRWAKFPNLRFPKRGTSKNDFIWLHFLDGLQSSTMLDPWVVEFIQCSSLTLVRLSSFLNITFVTVLPALKSLAPGKQEVSTLSPGHTLFPSNLRPRVCVDLHVCI